MINIAICDDVEEILIELKKYLSEYQNLKGCIFNIHSFTNAEDLWDYLQVNKCDLIVLDIELVHMNGVILGKMIRNVMKDFSIQIIYISSKDGYDRQLFDVQPLNFLPKPIDKNKLFKMIDLSAELRQNREKIFVFENRQGTFRIKISGIIYFESFDHYYKIITTSGSYEFKSTLSEIKKQINDCRFIQVHRSYIINYENVCHIKYEEITMCNGDVVPISRERRKNVRSIISVWEREKI